MRLWLMLLVGVATAVAGAAQQAGISDYVAFDHLFLTLQQSPKESSEQWKRRQHALSHYIGLTGDYEAMLLAAEEEFEQLQSSRNTPSYERDLSNLVLRLWINLGPAGDTVLRRYLDNDLKRHLVVAKPRKGAGQ